MACSTAYAAECQYDQGHLLCTPHHISVITINMPSEAGLVAYIGRASCICCFAAAVIPLSQAYIAYFQVDIDSHTGRCILHTQRLLSEKSLCRDFSMQNKLHLHSHFRRACLLAGWPQTSEGASMLNRCSVPGSTTSILSCAFAPAPRTRSATELTRRSPCRFRGKQHNTDM